MPPKLAFFLTCLFLSLFDFSTCVDPPHLESIDRMLSLSDRSDSEVDAVERERRETARRRETAEVCLRAQDGEESVGCVLEGAIPPDTTYLVTFQHRESGDDPSICWHMCQAVFPNTSLALVAWKEETGLNCHCGMSAAVSDRNIGPQRCCQSVCEKSGRQCGGGMSFSNGFSEDCYNVYCVPGEGNETAAATADGDGFGVRAADEIGHTFEDHHKAKHAIEKGDDDDDASDEKGEDVDAEVEALLTSLYLAQLRNNVVGIVMVGLLAVVIILVLMLLVWAWMYVDAVNDPRNTQPAFYRRLSGARRPQQQPILNNTAASEPKAENKAKEANYGATNQAFDPTPDSDPVFTAEKDSSVDGGEEKDGPDPSRPKVAGRLPSQSSVMTDETDRDSSVAAEDSVSRNGFK